MNTPDLAVLVAQYKQKISVVETAAIIAQFETIRDHLKQANETQDVCVVAAILTAGLFASND